MNITSSNINYNSPNTPVTHINTYAGNSENIFCMIDNYIYLYHTDTLIAMPTYPDELADSMGVNFNKAELLSRSAPIYSYAGSGPRSINIKLRLHRDMMNRVNVSQTKLKLQEVKEVDYVDLLVKQLQAAALPRYASAEKMVDPPIIAIRFGKDFFCKGVIIGSLTTTYSGPILRTDKYACVDIDFQISEIDPYDAVSVQSLGHNRGITQDLERRVYRM